MMQAADQEQTPWEQLTQGEDLQLTWQLDEAYDADRLREELQHLAEQASFVEQHGKYHDGGWTSIALVSSDGDPLVDAPRGNYKPTPYFAQAPYMASIISGFKARKMRCRLLALAPGADIHWHCDDTDCFDYGAARLHVPIITNDAVQMQISHQQCQWKPGELWYGDFSFPHRLHNGSDETRIHLVIDVGVNSNVKSRMPRSIFDQQALRKRLRQRTRELFYGEDRDGPLKRMVAEYVKAPLRRLVYSVYR